MYTFVAPAFNTLSANVLALTLFALTTILSWSLYGSRCCAFLLGETVCAGYAEAVSLLLNGAGITNHPVTSETHEWNRVYMYGKWYNVDATWGDTGYDPDGWFNKSDATMQAGNTDLP